MSLEKMDNFNRVAFRRKYRSLDSTERKGETHLECSPQGLNFSLGVSLWSVTAVYGWSVSLSRHVSLGVVGKAWRTPAGLCLHTALQDRYED